MAKCKKTKTEKAHDKLTVALKQFNAEQGMTSRRNVRKALSVALAAVRKAVDEEFPAVRKPPKRVGRLTPGLRRRRLKERGMKCVGHALWRPIAQAGIKPVKDPYTIDGEKKMRQQNRIVPIASLPNIPYQTERWVPVWAAELQKLLTATTIQRHVANRFWERAKKRGNARHIVTAELYVVGAAHNGLTANHRRIAIKRLRIDRDFRDAILAVGPIGFVEVKSVLKAQLASSTPKSLELR